MRRWSLEELEQQIQTHIGLYSPLQTPEVLLSATSSMETNETQLSYTSPTMTQRFNEWDQQYGSEAGTQQQSFSFTQQAGPQTWPYLQQQPPSQQSWSFNWNVLLLTLDPSLDLQFKQVFSQLKLLVNVYTCTSLPDILPTVGNLAAHNMLDMVLIQPDVILRDVNIVQQLRKIGKNFPLVAVQSAPFALQQWGVDDWIEGPGNGAKLRKDDLLALITKWRIRKNQLQEVRQVPSNQPGMKRQQMQMLVTLMQMVKQLQVKVKERKNKERQKREMEQYLSQVQVQETQESLRNSSSQEENQENEIQESLRNTSSFDEEREIEIQESLVISPRTTIDDQQEENQDSINEKPSSNESLGESQVLISGESSQEEWVSYNQHGEIIDQPEQQQTSQTTQSSRSSSQSDQEYGEQPKVEVQDIQEHEIQQILDQIQFAQNSKETSQDYKNQQKEQVLLETQGQNLKQQQQEQRQLPQVGNNDLKKVDNFLGPTKRQISNKVMLVKEQESQPFTLKAVKSHGRSSSFIPREYPFNQKQEKRRSKSFSGEMRQAYRNQPSKNVPDKNSTQVKSLQIIPEKSQSTNKVECRGNSLVDNNPRNQDESSQRIPVKSQSVKKVKSRESSFVEGEHRIHQEISQGIPEKSQSIKKTKSRGNSFVEDQPIIIQHQSQNSVNQDFNVIQVVQRQSSQKSSNDLELQQEGQQFIDEQLGEVLVERKTSEVSIVEQGVDRLLKRALGMQLASHPVWELEDEWDISDVGF